MNILFLVMTELSPEVVLLDISILTLSKKFHPYTGNEISCHCNTLFRNRIQT